MHTNILKKNDIEREAGRAKTHFLNDKAQRNNKSLGDILGLTGLGVHMIEVEPGMASTEFHMHYFEDECTYVLEGTGTVTIGHHREVVTAGDFIAYPKDGEAHTMVNTGSEVLRCLVIGERAAHDIVDYPLAGKRLYRNQGQPWSLMDIDSISEVTSGTKIPSKSSR